MLAAQLLHGRAHRLFGERVQSGSGLVKDQQGRIAIQRPSNADALALPAGKAYAALAYTGIQPLWQTGDEFLQLGGLQRSLQSRLIDLRARHSKGDIFPDAGVQQEYLLRHQPDLLLPGRQVFLYVTPVHQDTSLLRAQKAQYQVQHAAFARAGGPDQGHRTALPDAQIDVLQGVL